MKRVGLYLGFPPDGGGAFQYASSILTALRALQGPQYHAVIVHANPAWKQWIGHEAHEIESHEVKTGSRDNLVQLLLRLGLSTSIWRRLSAHMGGVERKLLSLNCDLWLFPAQEYLSYAIPGKTICTIHDLMHRYQPSFPEVAAWGLYRRRERHYKNMCGHSSAILVDSEIGKSHVISSYAPPSERIHVLPYTAPTYIHNRSSSDCFDSRYRLPDQYIFYPAQFWRHKNHVRLIEALALARRQFPALCLVLAGSEKNNGAIARKTAAKLGLSEAVLFLNYVPTEDMAELYRRSLGLVMPTFFGPTNIPPLEAMATEVPMALSDIYAMREQSGDAAIYFDPSSTTSIADAIVALVGDHTLRRGLIANARSRRGHLSQANFNKRFAEIIRTVVPE